MKIKKISRTQPNFCALKRTPDVKYFLRGISKDAEANFDLLELLNKDVPIDVYVSIKRVKEKNKLIAEVGNKTFKENIFRNPIKTVRKALEYASKLACEQNETNKLTEGMSIPKLDLK